MIILPANNKISRDVTEKDIPKILSLLPEMLELLGSHNGRTNYAVAHCQVDDVDPMRFFVTIAFNNFKDKIIINPQILRATKVPVDSLEACMSFPDKEHVIVKRSNKVAFRYAHISQGLLWYDFDTVSGKGAVIVQHEIDHFDGKNIYNA